MDIPGYADWDEYMDNLKRIQNEAKDLQDSIRNEFSDALDEIKGLSEWCARWEKTQLITDSQEAPNYSEIGDMGVDLAKESDDFLSDMFNELGDLVRQIEDNLDDMTV